MDWKSILIIIISLTSLTISLINLLYVINKYNLKIKIAEKISNDTINYLKKIREFISLEEKLLSLPFSKEKTIYASNKPNPINYQKIIDLDKINLIFWDYLSETYKFLLSLNFNYYFCTECKCIQKLSDDWIVKIEKKLNFEKIHYLADSDIKNKVNQLIIDNSIFDIFFDNMYYFSTFKFKVFLFKRKKTIEFDFCLKCVVKIYKDFIYKVINFYDELLIKLNKNK